MYKDYIEDPIEKPHNFINNNNKFNLPPILVPLVGLYRLILFIKKNFNLKKIQLQAVLEK